MYTAQIQEQDCGSKFRGFCPSVQSMDSILKIVRVKVCSVPIFPVSFVLRSYDLNAMDSQREESPAGLLPGDLDLWRAITSSILVGLEQVNSSWSSTKSVNQENGLVCCIWSPQIKVSPMGRSGGLGGPVLGFRRGIGWSSKMGWVLGVSKDP
jgi:hypothetical protein